MALKQYTKFYTFFLASLFIIITSACKKENKVAPSETSTVTDIDGNIYKTIKIGNQWWMAENLKVTRYNDSTTINKMVLNISPSSNIPDTTWANSKKGAYCIYNDENANAKIYGLLYNWYAVSNSKNIAPVGWHIPSDDEWKTLEKQLGMNASDAEKTSWRGTTEAQKLKQLKLDESSGQPAWAKDQFGDLYENNQSGFSALAGGCCMFNGIWSDYGLTYTGFWWSSTTNGNQVWYRYLDYKNTNIFRYYGAKTYGFSIRCVKN